MVNWSKTNVNSNSLAWKNENTGSDIIGYWIKCMHLKGLETYNFSLTENDLNLFLSDLKTDYQISHLTNINYVAYSLQERYIFDLNIQYLQA